MQFVGNINNSTPLIEAEKEKILNLSATLNRLSKEAVSKELATRAEISTAAERLIASRKTQNELSVAQFKREAFTVTVEKSFSEASPGFVLTVVNDNNNKGDIIQQQFVQASGAPLQVLTFREGERRLPKLAVATNDDKMYLRMLLEELSQ